MKTTALFIFLFGLQASATALDTLCVNVQARDTDAWDNVEVANAKCKQSHSQEDCDNVAKLKEEFYLERGIQAIVRHVISSDVIAEFAFDCENNRVLNHTLTWVNGKRTWTSSAVKFSYDKDIDVVTIESGNSKYDLKVNSISTKWGVKVRYAYNELFGLKKNYVFLTKNGLKTVLGESVAIVSGATFPFGLEPNNNTVTNEKLTYYQQYNYQAIFRELSKAATIP